MNIDWSVICVCDNQENKWWSDRDIMKRLVQENGLILEIASTEIKRDREIVLLAVKSRGEAIRFADQEFHLDREILMISLKTYDDAIECAKLAHQMRYAYLLN